MAWGVATALLDAGRERDQLGLFEVDEAWLPAVARDTDPRLLLLSNLFRDQLDRYGELELLADRWAELTAELDGRARFVLNADDPLVADLGRERSGVTYFGVEDDSQALPGMQHAADSKHCRNCGHAYEYEAVYLGHMGRYRCPNCGRTRPEPQVAATERDARRHERLARRAAHAAGRAGARRCRSPGSTTSTTRSPPRPRRSSSACRSRRVGEALEGFGGAFGRVETIPVGGRQRVDPPDQEPGRRERGAAHAHARGRRSSTSGSRSTTASPTAATSPGSGTPTSRCWPAASGSVTCSGTRAEEMALRLKYAGIDAEPDGGARPRRLARRARWRTPPGERVYALPTYTALLELRDLLAEPRAREAVVRVTGTRA